MSKKLRDSLLKFSEKISSYHQRFFSYLAKRSKTSVWFTFLLLFMALYEIVEHFIIPLALLWFGLSR